MSSGENQMKYEEPEGVVMGDMPNLEGFQDQEVMSALANIDEAIHNADQRGREKYGAGNWDLINAK